MPARLADDRVALLELDIDLRLFDLWVEAEQVQVWDLESVSAFMRAAYGKGYTDALQEPEPAKLHRDNGYKAPRRRAA